MYKHPYVKVALVILRKKLDNSITNECFEYLKVSEACCMSKVISTGNVLNHNLPINLRS